LSSDKKSTNGLISKNSFDISTFENNKYIKAATSENTRKAYQSDIKHFENNGGKLPANPHQIAMYLQQYAENLNPRTLSRRLTAIKNWHVYQGFTDPTAHPAIIKTISGINRLHGKPKQKAYPLSPKDLFKIVSYLHNEGSIAAIRDSALLQVGYFGAFRRSELVAIKVEDITFKDQGAEVILMGSKTDQENQGQYVALAFGKDKLCPVKALNNWLDKAKIHNGSIFRGINKKGIILNNQLTPLSVNIILKRRAAEAGIKNIKNLSSHSLRRGLATYASLAGADVTAIMRQGRWKQINTVMEYIEASARFSENVASKILECL